MRVHEMARKVSYRAPFDRNGNLQHYPSEQFVLPEGATWTEKGYQPPGRYVDPEWRDIEPFHATMTLEPGVTSGRSAKYVHWRDQDGHQYPMFVSELVDLVVSGAAKEGGVAEGDWIVCKRGANYGIRYVRREAK